MNFKLPSKAILASSLFISLFGCKNSSPKFEWTDKKGVFIVNEGNFSHGNASLSFYDPSSKAITNNLFELVNNRPLGDVAQSITEINGKYYIVVNNSGKVEIVANADFISTGVINGLAQPRYMLAIDDQKAYISQWGSGIDGSLAVINLSTNSITKTIPTGAGAEKMVKVGNFVYVTNSGGFGSDSTIAVINSSADTLVTKIKVGYDPQAIVADKNNKLWVLCGGKWKDDFSALEQPGALVKINPSNNEVELTLKFTSMIGSYDRKPLLINKAKDLLFYTLDGNVYEKSINSSTLNTSAKINRDFYNLGLDPETDVFYGADIRNGTTNGWIIRYNSSYARVDSLQVGIYPDETFFN
jgi:hypothetical protein